MPAILYLINPPISIVTNYEVDGPEVKAIFGKPKKAFLVHSANGTRYHIRAANVSTIAEITQAELEAATKRLQADREAKRIKDGADSEAKVIRAKIDAATTVKEAEKDLARAARQKPGLFIPGHGLVDLALDKAAHKVDREMLGEPGDGK